MQNAQAIDQMTECVEEVLREAQVADTLRQPHAVDELTAKLQHAAEAHHRYEQSTGDDADWPRWYARHMLHLKPEIDW